MRYSFNFSFIFLIFFSSCNTEPSVVVSQNEKTPVSIARNFTMTYTDSTLTKSFVSGKTHYDFTNDQLNFSEFFEDVELIIYDDNDNIIQEVEPKIGTMVIFLSEKFPHEVLKTNKNRYAIAGWFKQR